MNSIVILSGAKRFVLEPLTSFEAHCLLVPSLLFIFEMGLTGSVYLIINYFPSFMNQFNFNFYCQTRACEHVHTSPNLFSAPQCLGYRNELGSATPEMCFPSEGTITKQVKLAVKEYKAKSIFVSSDHDHLIPLLIKALKRMEVFYF